MLSTKLIFVGLLMVASVTAWLTAQTIRIRRPARGALAFWLFAVLGVTWAFSYAGELIAIHEHDKLLWIRISYLARPYIATVWLVFVLRYGSFDRHLKPVWVALLLIIPAMTTILAWSNPWHGMMWADLAFSYDGLLPRFTPTPAPFYKLYVIHTDVMLIASIVLILRRQYRSQPAYWGQTLLPLLIMGVPWLNTALFRLGMDPLPGVHLGAFSFVLLTPLGAWLFFRYRLVEMLPSTRAMVIRGMPDAVLIISPEGRVLAVNPAGERIFGANELALRDQSIRGLLSQISAELDSYDGRSLLQLKQEVNGHWYDLRIQPLETWLGTSPGYILILHDVHEAQMTWARLEQQRALTDALRDTASTLNSTLNLNEVLDRILNNLSRVIPHEAANIMLINEEGSAAHIVKLHGDKYGPHREDLFSLNIPVRESGKMQRMIRTGKPTIIEDTGTSDQWLSIPETGWIKSWAGAPIIHEYQIIGFLNLDSDVPGRYTEAIVEPLQAFADQAALAISNARLYEEARRGATDLQILHRVSLDMTTELDVERTLHVIAESATRLLNADGAGIYVLDTEKDALVWTIALGSNVAPLGAQLSKGEGISGRVWATGEPLIVNDYSVWHGGADQYKHLALSAVLAVPIVWRGELLGVVNVLKNAGTGGFTPRDQRMLTQLAQQAAIAMQNANLYSDLQTNVSNLEQRNEELNAFGYMVAHDLRSPLGAISGYAELALSMLTEELTPSIREAMTNILGASHMMEQTIASMMLLAQLTAHEGAFEAIPLQTVVDSVMLNYQPQLTASAMDIVSDPLPVVMGHEGWLYEVVGNLIGNAIKYSGGRNPNPTLHIRATEKDGQARIEFEDNGVGIAEKDQVQVFEAFTRFNQQEASGFGLGLSIARRIIERLGGTIGVNSQPGQGSIFWFTLPLADTEAKHDQHRHTV